MVVVSDVREQIKSDLVIVGTDYDSQIDTAIRSALRQLRARKFWFLEKYADLTLSSGYKSLTLPSDFGAPGSFDIIRSGQRFVDGQGFDLLNFAELRAQYWAVEPPISGSPFACAVSNVTLYFSHTADADYTVPAVYYRKDATPPTASETSVWFDDGYDVVRSMAQYIFKRDSQHYTPSEEDGTMVANYMNSLERQHERYVGGV